MTTTSPTLASLVSQDNQWTPFVYSPQRRVSSPITLPFNQNTHPPSQTSATGFTLSPSEANPSFWQADGITDNNGSGQPGNPVDSDVEWGPSSNPDSSTNPSPTTWPTPATFPAPSPQTVRWSSGLRMPGQQDPLPSQWVPNDAQTTTQSSTYWAPLNGLFGNFFSNRQTAKPANPGEDVYFSGQYTADEPVSSGLNDPAGGGAAPVQFQGPEESGPIQTLQFAHSKGSGDALAADGGADGWRK